MAVVAGAGEGYDRKVIRYTKPGIKDWERYTEIYVDARDIQREEGQSETDYENVLRQRGIEKLEEYLEAENFEADVVSDVYEYKKEWNLGDIVSVSHEAWGITESYRITEVEEVYEARSRKITPVFGTPLPELINLGGD